MSAATAAEDVIWVRNLLKELGYCQLTPMPTFIDNQGTVKLIENNQVHSKTKTLDIKLHFIRDINNVKIKVTYVPTDEQLADIFTKPLQRDKFNQLLKQINLL